MRCSASLLPAYLQLGRVETGPSTTSGARVRNQQEQPWGGGGDTDCSLVEPDEFFRAESTRVPPLLHGCYRLESNHAPGPRNDAKRACKLSAQICLCLEPRTCSWGWQCVQPRGEPPRCTASQFLGCWDFERCNTQSLGGLQGLQPWWPFCTGKPPASPTSCTQRVLTYLGRDHLSLHASLWALEMEVSSPRSHSWGRHSYLAASHHPVCISNQASASSGPRGAASALRISLPPFPKGLGFEGLALWL